MKSSELLIAVLAQLEREQAVSIPQLAQLLDCSEEQIFDALETLVFAYDAASIRLDLHDTYATLATQHRARLLRLTPHEADILVDALKQVGLSENDELTRKLLDSKSVLADSPNTASGHMRTIGEGTQTSVAQVLAAACEDEEHHAVRIAYRGENDVQTHGRVIEPAAFFSKGGKRYLLAYCRKAKDWRSFRLDRVKEAEILDERYTPRSNAPSMAQEFMQAAVDAHVRFTPDAALPNWHGMRVIRTLEDGSHVARVDWVGSSWLPKHIVAMTGEAVPLDPPELIEACRDFAESLQRCGCSTGGGSSLRSE